MQMTRLQGSPLSIQQTRLWTWQKKSSVYQTLCAVQIQGVVQRNKLSRAVRRIVERHEILRTRFYTLPGMDLPVQVIDDSALWSWSEINLEDLDSKNQGRKLDELWTALQEGSGDRDHDPLLQIQLLRLAEARHIMVVSLPALCADSSSIKLFIDELRRATTEEVLTEEVLQYADVSAWQEEVLLKDEAELERQYWRKTDLAQIPTMRLPFEQEGDVSEKKRDDKTFTPRVVKIPLQDGLAQQVETQAQQRGVSSSSWLLTCWQVLLWRLSDEPTLVIGVARDGRTYEELANALGLYTRFVPVNATLEKDHPFERVLASVNLSLEEATKHQMYFTWNGEDDPMGKDITASFFPVSFEYETWPPTFDAGALTFSLVQLQSCTEPFALKLRALHVGEDLQLELHYDLQSLSSRQAHRLVTLLQTLVQHAVLHPHLPVGSLPILDSPEQAQLLALGNGPHSLVSAQGLHRLFEAQVKRTPSQLAVISVSDQLTYQQLNERANQLAHVLRRRGVGPNVMVGLCMRRGVQMLVGLLGILKAGGAYVPLDAENPPARLISQLQQSQAMFLLSEQRLGSLLPEWEERTFWLENLEQEMAQAPAGDLLGGSQGEDLAYVIYTSGSTGVPKGVMIQQSSVVNYTLALCELFGVEPGWQYATVSTLAADLGNTAIFCALVSGGCVQVLDSETFTSTEAMARWVREHPIDILKIVPSHLSALLTGVQAKELLPKRALVLGGEALPLSLLKRLGDLGGTCQIYNHYGPTETTIGVLVNRLGAVERADEQTSKWKPVALGRPISNVEVYVLDRRMQLVPVGVTGELYIGGIGLARGYSGLPEQTAQCFVPHPWSQYAGARLYRTGDLVRYGEDGRLEFVGRRDSQVKLRGYRIELAEIEAVLSCHPQIRESVVVQREHASGEPQLVSYVVAQQRTSLAPEQLREFLRQFLPEYMIPAMFVQLETLPLTTNGKVDRLHLPRPEQRAELEQVVVADPRSPIEEIVLEIWRDLLGFSELGIHDHFFRVGGHSLLATRVMARIQSMLQIAFPVQLLFQAPTVAELAQRVEQALRKGEGRQEPPLVARERPEEIPLSFAQQRLWFLDQLEPGSTAYLAPRAQRLVGNLNPKALEQSLQELMRRHEILRTTFEERAGQPVQMIHPAGSYILPVIDLRGLREEEREQQARQLASQERQHPCDLATGPLLRTSLLRLELQEHVLLLTLHHIITDGWSNGVLVRELTTLYQAFLAGLPSPLAPLPIQYADYALWQREWLQGEVLQASLSYWRSQLAGIAPLELPTDHPRPLVQTYWGASQMLSLSPILSEKLLALSGQQNVTLFMLLLAAFGVLLARYTGQCDISVGTPIANRRYAEIEGIIGFFVNTLVLRTDLSGNPTFLEVLQRVRQVCLEAYTHQDIPFEKVVEELEPERDLSRSPLFQVMLVLHNTPPSGQGELAGVSLKPLSAESQISKFDLTLSMVQTEQGLRCWLEYNTDLFEASTITRMLSHWQTVLEGVVDNPQARVSDLPLLAAAERECLLVAWNATQREYPQELCVHQLFEQQVERTYDAVALVFEDEMLTYGQLNRRANQLAHYLQGRGVGPEVMVGLCLERSIEMVVGLLAILKAGGAYVPLDPSYPQERLAFMIEDSQVVTFVTHHLLEGHQPVVDGIKVINLENWQKVATQRSENPHSHVIPDNLAYVLYTSGSTGQPKGVMVKHRNVTNFFTAMDKRLGEHVPGVWLALTSISFDISVLELFWTLTQGFQVVLRANYDERSLYRSQHKPISKNLEFSLFYFANDTSGQSGNKYRLLLEGAKFADTHNFTAVWTPERHFHSFGGLYPNPSVTSAAIAAVTQRVKIRAGSVVLPLHDPVRVAEEWAVVDNLSGGRIGIAFATGWHANDFVLAPEHYTDRKKVVVEKMATVRQLWQGETIALRTPKGNEVQVRIYPQPIQSELPIWITSGGNPETFRQAGEMGVNLLTHLLGQSIEELAEKIALYREARRKQGHLGSGHVTLMVHTFLGTNSTTVREQVRHPFYAYLRSSVELVSTLAQTLGYPSDMTSLSEDDMDAILAHGFDRYYETSGLMGTVSTCLPMVERLKEIGVDEVACLIDFGIDEDSVLASLHELAKLKHYSNKQRTFETIPTQIKRLGITHLQCTPSQASMFLLEPEALSALASLQKILLGGEAFPISLARQLEKGLLGDLYNMYGPTETTIWSTMQSVEKSTNIISIGRPITNTQIYILDKHLQLQPIGVAGELFIGGRGVVRGYLNHPELTAERFLPDPFSGELGTLIYKTGDLARYLPDGTIEFLGRIDHQVKMRGYRIELGEIEVTLGQHPAIQECVVLIQEDASGEKRLVAYLVMQQGQTFTRSDLLSYLQNRLPSYMIPSIFVPLQTLPLTPNGKVDRQALLMPQEPTDVDLQALEEARTPIEELLMELWGEILSRRQVGIHDNFFEQGGHSLLATQLIARLRSMLAVEVPLRALFEAPTVAGLAQRIEQVLRKGEEIQIPPLLAKARPDEIPLSFAQQRLWFLDQLVPGNTAYLEARALRVDGELNVYYLERSLHELTRRHESLRTTFTEREGQIVQVIHQTSHSHLPIIDLQRLLPKQREEEARKLAQQEAQYPCDLAKGPLLRSYLLHLEAHEHVLLLTLHHIITDGWSNRILVRELGALYHAHVSGLPCPLAPLPLQYADYALWQREWLQGEVLQQHLEYWKKQLWRVKPLALPTDTPHMARQSHRGARYPFHLPAKLSEELVTLSRQEKVTLFMLLLAAFQVVLYRWTGQTDIVVGTDIANRTHVETEDLIGFFVNILALRTEVQGASSFHEIVQQVRAMMLRAYAHQELPFDVVVEHLQLERKDKQTPLVQVLFILQNIPKNTEGLSGITFEPIQEESPSVKFDLAFFLKEGPQGIGGSVLYRAELFQEQTIATLVQRFEVMLRNAVLKPETPIDELEISTDEEKAEQMRYKENMRINNRKRLRSLKSKALNLSAFPSSLRKLEKDQ